MEKRKLPYSSNLSGFELKRQNREFQVNPGKEWSNPKPFEALVSSATEHRPQTNGTDFNNWSPEEIKAFLDARGGDYDDCRTFADLIERAAEVEINTGPATKQQSKIEAEDEEYDPLDAFMAEINQTVKSSTAVAVKKGQGKASLACDEELDPGTEYMQVKKGLNSRVAAAVADKGYDSDDEVYATAKAIDAAHGDADEDSDTADPRRRKDVDPLAPLEHSSIEYEEFAKDFYEESEAVKGMTDEEVVTLRRAQELRIAGFDAPRPVRAFEDCGFDAPLMDAIRRAGYTEPTAIQAQALPAALSGRDVLGVAKTGSGKTAAFVLPMLTHLLDQRELAKGEGPVALVVAPTRELSEQIHKEARRFAKPYGIRVAAAFGGLSKFEQFKALKAGAEVAVCTPGRMIDLIRMKACTMTRTTFLVFDEADRMFDMGFEPQVRSLAGQIRPDRQTLLFTATLPRKIERLVADALSNPVRINVGMQGVANVDVVQSVQVFESDAGKQAWLIARIQDFVDEGDVIVFASQRAKVEAVHAALAAAGVKASALHGDMDQYTRMGILDAFKGGRQHVLVATDVLARGLDIKTIKTVINFDAARDFETHIHRVGRTGRAGDKEGCAVTLLLPSDARFAGQLLQSLALAGQDIPRPLHELALKDPSFKKGNQRNKGGKARKPQLGGAGLGFGGGSTGGAAVAAGSGVLAGFARSSKDYLNEASASAGSGSGSSATWSVQRPVSTSSAPSGFVSASIHTGSTGGRFPPPPPLPSASGTAGGSTSSGGGNGAEDAIPAVSGTVKTFNCSRFGKSSFVSSGSTGGDLKATAVVVPARVQSSRPSTVPAPVSVHDMPLYLSRQQQPQQFGRYSSGYRQPPPSNHQPPPQALYSSTYSAAPAYGSTIQSSAVAPPISLGAGFSAQSLAQARAAAEAVAARLGAQMAGGAPPSAAPPSYPDADQPPLRNRWDTR